MKSACLQDLGLFQIQHVVEALQSLGLAYRVVDLADGTHFDGFAVTCESGSANQTEIVEVLVDVARFARRQDVCVEITINGVVVRLTPRSSVTQAFDDYRARVRL